MVAVVDAKPGTAAAGTDGASEGRARTVREIEIDESTSTSLPEPNASAPPTISTISVVIDAWRARFIVMLRFLISSSALSVADFIAR